MASRQVGLAALSMRLLKMTPVCQGSSNPQVSSQAPRLPGASGAPRAGLNIGTITGTFDCGKALGRCAGQSGSRTTGEAISILWMTPRVSSRVSMVNCRHMGPWYHGASPGRPSTQWRGRTAA